MFKTVIFAAALAATALTATSSFAGMSDERVQKRDEIWSQDAQKGDWQTKNPGSYASEEILPERQDRHRVMG